MSVNGTPRTIGRHPGTFDLRGGSECPRVLPSLIGFQSALAWFNSRRADLLDATDDLSGVFEGCFADITSPDDALFIEHEQAVLGVGPEAVESFEATQILVHDQTESVGFGNSQPAQCLGHIGDRPSAHSDNFSGLAKSLTCPRTSAREVSGNNGQHPRL